MVHISLAMAVERIIEDGDFVLASWRNVLIRVGRGASSAERVATIHQHASRLLPAYPDGVAILMWLHAGSVIPSNETRRRSGEMLQDLGPKLQCLVAVVEGTGFWASSIRSVLTGLMLVSRMTFPLKTFDTIDKGTEWMSTQLRPAVTPGELLTVARELAEPRL